MSNITRPSPQVAVIGGGLAGCEAAWQLACAGVPVRISEMRPVRATEAHQTKKLCELVCSNSFRSDDWQRNAVGLLHEEMRRAGSLILQTADANKVPAGGALAVDREAFSAAVQRALEDHPLVTIVREEMRGLPGADAGPHIIATGPLTSPALGADILTTTGEETLAFFDAIAPVIHKDSIDFSRAWFQSRYDKEGPGGDKAAYINCPLSEAQYNAFLDEMIEADPVEFKQWEKDTPYFEGCLPVEVMISRGRETLRFGPMKPVGLTDPSTGARAHAVLQLRQDNALGTLYNMVGFQTKLRHADQVRIFQMIPGLENARFARLGGIHRNTFLNSPALLDNELRLKSRPNVRFAGQIIGVEGYVESASMGLLAARFLAAEIVEERLAPPPITTALGALLNHITEGQLGGGTFQPMNVNFGLFPPMEKKVPKNERRAAYAERALHDVAGWLQHGVSFKKVAVE